MSNTNGIQGSPLLHTLLAQSNAISNRDVRANASTNSSASIGRDSAEVSAASAALNSTAVDPARAAKVVAIQRAIANGTYAVSAGAVADKLLQNMLDGSGK